jgi:hypothetical protein
LNMEDELKYFSTRGGDERLTFEEVSPGTSLHLISAEPRFLTFSALLSPRQSSPV